MARVLVSAVIVVASSMLMGCALQLPKTNQVTFDYSDYAYYDRGYAVSPSVAQAAESTTVEAAQADANVAEGRVDAPTTGATH